MAVAGQIRRAVVTLRLSAISAVSNAVMVCSGAGSQAVAAAMASQHISSSLLATWAVSATAWMDLDHLPLAMKPLFKNVRHDRLGRTFRQPALQVDVEVTSEARHPRGYAGSMLVASSITPLSTGEGVGEIVAEAVRVVRESGLPNRTDAMFTNIVCLTHC
jgi:hypothetical protein